MSEVFHQRGRLAALTRSRTPEDPELLSARRNLAAAKLREYVARTIAQAPPLTDAQREEIAAMLRPTAGGDAA